MAAGIYRLKLEQGTKFDTTFTYKNDAGALVDLTGYSARMQMRSSFTSTTKLLDLTSGNEITLGGNAGTIRVQIDSTVTAALEAPAINKWDLELLPAAVEVDAFRLLEGDAIVSPEVTK